MPDHIYEVLAQGARYWFLFWMALIVWRSWRWYRKDKRAAKKRLKLLPDAGYVGEMVVMEGSEQLPRGTVFAVPREGTLGTLRTNDLCVQERGVEKRHLWFRFDDRKGLMVQPFGRNAVNVDGEDFQNRHDPLYMAHGSWLTVGGVQMRLRLFAGFESVGHAVRRSAPIAQDPPEPELQPVQPMTQEQLAQMMAQQWQMQQMQQAYQQGYQQAMAQQSAQAESWQQEEYEEDCPQTEEPEWTYDEDPEALPYEMAQIAREEGLVDNRIFMRPEGQKKPDIPEYEPTPAQPETVFYPPEMDVEPEPDMEDWVLDADEDMTDAAAPPKSAYVGHDEAARAKREVWDKYFGGGAKQ